MEELVAQVMYEYAILCREVYMDIERETYDEEEVSWIAKRMFTISDVVHNLPHYVLREDKSLLKSEVESGLSKLNNMSSQKYPHKMMMFISIRKAFRELESFLSEK